MKKSHQIYLDVCAVIVEATGMGNDRIVDAHLGVMMNLNRIALTKQKRAI